MTPQRPRIGQILLAKKLISQLELNTALQHQERFGGRLGTILAKLNYITESDLVQILSEIYRVPIVHLESSRAQPEALNLVPVNIAKKHHVLPLRVERGAGGRRVLHLALSEPQNASAVDEIRFLTEISSIQTYLAPPTTLEKAISLYYDRPNLAAGGGTTGVPVPEAREEMVIVRSHADEEVLIEGDQGVTGRLRDMGLTDLVQVLGAGGKTARVQLTARGVVGDMYLDEGQIVHAECGALKGERAFFEMLSWTDGNFTILPQVKPSSRTIQVSNDALILEGLRQLDERGEQTTEEEGISFQAPSEGGLAVDTIQVEAAGDLGLPPASVAPGASSDAEPAPAAQRRDPASEQMRRLLRILVRKKVLTEEEARWVFTGRTR